MRTKPPCKVDGVDCRKRYVGCRAGCDEWHKWLAIHDQEKAMYHGKVRDDNDVKDFLVSKMDRAKRYRKSKHTD
jgi:hypothetical protein